MKKNIVIVALAVFLALAVWGERREREYYSNVEQFANFNVTRMGPMAENLALIRKGKVEEGTAGLDKLLGAISNDSYNYFHAVYRSWDFPPDSEATKNLRLVWQYFKNTYGDESVSHDFDPKKLPQSILILFNRPDSPPRPQVSHPYPQEGESAPSFTYATIGGQSGNMEDLRRTVVVVMLFTTSCPICQAELPRLETDLWRRFKGEHVKVLAIGNGNTQDELARFAKEKEFTFDFVPDPMGSIFKMFAEQGVPRTYVINRRGLIAYKTVGFEEGMLPQLTNAVKTALAEAP
jgi:peroxiredoxin